MVITKIEAQKKKGRYNIYLNDAFAFGVDEATVVKYALFKGTELTKEFNKKQNGCPLFNTGKHPCVQLN